jgi:hypothetical protein
MRTISLMTCAAMAAFSLHAQAIGVENPLCYLCEGDATATMMSSEAVIDISFLMIDGVTFVTCEQIKNAGLARLLNSTMCLLASTSNALGPCQCSNSAATRGAAGGLNLIPGLRASGSSLSPAPTPSWSPTTLLPSIVTDVQPPAGVPGLPLIGQQIKFEKKNDVNGKGMGKMKTGTGMGGKGGMMMKSKKGKGSAADETDFPTPSFPDGKGKKSSKDPDGKGKSTKNPKSTTKSPKAPNGKGKSTKVTKSTKAPKAPNGKGTSTKGPKSTKAPKDTVKGKSTKVPKFEAAYVDSSGLEYDSNGDVNLVQYLDRLDGIPYYDSSPTSAPSIDIDEEIYTLESMVNILKQKRVNIP